MKKLLIAGNLLFTLSILGACGSEEAEDNTSNDTAEMNDQQDSQDMDEPAAKAQVLQSSDGFVAVKTDGLEVTDVSNFKNMQEVEDHLNEKDMEEDMSG